MDLQAFFASLSLVAISPYAFVAYILLTCAWFVLGLRVKRNKNLLDALEKLPEKQRLPALQAEMGHVSPPRGLTPEQWLTSRIARYYFFGFLAFCFCATFLGLAAYIFAPEKPAEKVSSSVNLYEGPTREIVPIASGTRELGENVLKYETKTNDDQSVTIEPDLPYLDNLAAGKEVNGLWDSDGVFSWEYPVVSVKVVNNSKSTLFVSAIEINVLESTTDVDRSIPVAVPDMFNVGRIRLLNEGWGAMHEAKLTIQGWRRYSRETGGNCAGPGRLIGKPAEFELGTIDDDRNVPVWMSVPSVLKGDDVACAIASLRNL